MRIAVLRFPGSNADWDSLHVARDVLDADAYYVFHKETSLRDANAVIVPGGFAYGDYLRPGAIACKSPIVASLREFAAAGGPVLGICNGFQILTELGLLPGALARNQQLRFECRDVHLKVETGGPFTMGATGSVLRLPIAHADGRYHCDADTLSMLEEGEQVAFRYCDAAGAVREGFPHNPNGSVANIAGIYNSKKNVLGMMPHPERASEAALGNDAGLILFRCLEAFLKRGDA
ncbi:MAG: phosphoribosylformylglycinamidine synthase subunit PurQ [Myxococcota bacterium]